MAQSQYSSKYVWLTTLIYVLVPNTVKLFAELENAAQKLGVFLNENEINHPPVYDFIIGGGSAGSVLANRLSKKYNTLLIERGGEPSPLQSIPLLATFMIDNPFVDYAYRTIPQKSSCLSLNKRQSLWSRGKNLGGSSNLNIQIYLRGHPKDYQNWVNITGDKRWSYENVLKYFKKSENYCNECESLKNDPTFNPNYHHKNGLLSVSKTKHPLIEYFLNASEWSGIPRIDLNGPYVEGCAPIVLTQKKGRRSSTGIAFLDPILKRKTLTILKLSRVYKILFKKSGDNTKAYGIEYEKFGVKHFVYASKEVIISAGSIDTPKILMLSGLGPKSHLESLGIPVIADLPVGKNLQDHVSSVVGPFLINQTTSTILERDLSIDSFTEYSANGTGPLATTIAGATSCFISNIAKEQGNSDWPDLQYLLMTNGISRVLTDAFARAYNVNKRMAEQFLKPVEGHDAFFILAVLARPKSRGELLLRSADYKDDPILDPKYFEDKENYDINVLLDGVKNAINISENSPSFAKLNSRLSRVPWPACKHHEFLSDEYWYCYIRNLSLTVWHYSGTCSMGRRDSPNAVVDEELRVIGIKNLRVIDASIIPEIVSINTNAPTIMIAERGAQLILDSYNSERW